MYTAEFYQIFVHVAYRMWPWLGPHLTALWSSGFVDDVILSWGPWARIKHEVMFRRSFWDFWETFFARLRYQLEVKQLQCSSECSIPGAKSSIYDWLVSFELSTLRLVAAPRAWPIIEHSVEIKWSHMRWEWVLWTPHTVQSAACHSASRIHSGVVARQITHSPRLNQTPISMVRISMGVNSAQCSFLTRVQSDRQTDAPCFWVEQLITRPVKNRPSAPPAGAPLNHSHNIFSSLSLSPARRRMWATEDAAADDQAWRWWLNQTSFLRPFIPASLALQSLKQRSCYAHLDPSP